MQQCLISRQVTTTRMRWQQVGDWCGSVLESRVLATSRQSCLRWWPCRPEVATAVPS
ncbi:unnamed protein product, partial [Symbiodinium microadriaticum]